MSLSIKDLKGTTAPTWFDDFSSILSKEISFGNVQKRKHFKQKFFAELEMLVSAGVDIKSAIDITMNKETNSIFKQQLLVLSDRLILGDSISEAMMHTNLFSLYDYNSVRIGEESSRIVAIFKSLHQYYENSIEQRRVVIQALSYPGIVLVTAFGAILFMIQFVVPMFKDIFARFKGELPRLTQLVISLSDFVSNNIYYILVCIFLLSVGIYSILRSIWFKRNAELLFKIPYLGILYKKIILAEFSETMFLFCTSKVPLDKALQMTSEMISFYPLSLQLGQIKKDLIMGSSFSEGLQKQSIFDKSYVAVIEAGEQVNKLEIVFERLSTQLKKDVAHQSQNLRTFIEPVIIIILAIVIAIILISIYLPLLSLNSTIGK